MDTPAPTEESCRGFAFPAAVPEALRATTATKTKETLPKMLPGVVLEQWKCCGRPRCRCTRGQLHGPYFYRFWREGGRLHKAYVRPADLEQVRAACNARLQFQKQLSAGWEDWRKLRDQIREVENR
jgi:hypothetical protein